LSLALWPINGCSDDSIGSESEAEGEEAEAEGEAEAESESESEAESEAEGEGSGCSVTVAGSCETMTCPSETVCVEHVSQISSTFTCEPIPDTCADGCPTCACIGTKDCQMDACEEHPLNLACGCGVAPMPCISRRSAKADIDYLNEADLRAVYGSLRDIRLARYRYKTEPAATRRHLGFIIDDDEANPAIAQGGERVDVYSYASMAVAALQVQAKKIEELEREVARLRASLQNESVHLQPDHKSRRAFTSK
jgi:hypothetical protein